jgi:hypothetical protein
MNQEIVTGTALDALNSETKGWIVGHFMPEGTSAHSAEVEVKMWSYDQQPEYGKKEFKGTELIIVEQGTLRIDLTPTKAGLPFTTRILYGRRRDHIIIPPGYIKKITVDGPTHGTCIRWPSIDGNNVEHP